MRLASIVGLVASAALAIAEERPAVPAKVPAAARVPELISRLGSARFAEREDSTRALDEIGADALDALHKATRSDDAEIRRRAAVLVQRIEKRLDTERILAPQHVQLNFKDIPVTRAVSELASKAQFPIHVEGDLSRLRNRTITLETANMPFWQAYELFCQRAGLVEKNLVPFQPTAAAAASDRDRRRLEEEMVRRSALNPYGMPGGPYDNRLVVVEGKMPTLPTHFAGAVRIRALPRHMLPGQGKVAGETGFTLEVSPEPRMQWQGVLNVNVDRAIDNHGQTLTCQATTQPAMATGDLIAQGIAPNGIVIINGYPVNQGMSQRLVPVRLKSEKEPSRAVKELRGRITAQVQTAPQALVTIDNVLKSVDKSVDGPDGLTVKVLKAEKQASGAVSIKVQMDMPNQGGMNVWGVNGRVFIKRRMIVNGNVVVSSELMDGGNSGLMLVDAKGKNFRLTNTQQEAMNFNGNTFQQNLALTFQPQAGQAEPAQLLYKGPRTVIIDVPFVLKDVPLP